MTDTQALPTDKELMALEDRFWEALKNRDAEAAALITADDCVIVGASGAMALDGAKLAVMMEAAAFEIESWRIDPIAYAVHEDLAVEGSKVSLDAHDASVWQRQDGFDWRNVLHTESIAGDPFGRDVPPRSLTASRAPCHVQSERYVGSVTVVPA